MKHVLVIDESPLFREYLRMKLSDNGLDVSAAINGLDGISKMRNNPPDLIIMDYNLNKSRQSALDVLREKKANPNTSAIPVIITAKKIDQKNIIELVQFNVKKVFSKPIKIDTLLLTLTEILGVTFEVDETPCIIEAHVNDEIVFIEIAKGLNRDKLDLLRFKIIELIELYEIRIPKVIVMISDIQMGFADAPNLQKLLDTVLQASRAKHQDIRILTKDEFAKKFVQSQKEYEDIEVVSNLLHAIDGLLSALDKSLEYGGKKAEIISDKILSAEQHTEAESMHLRFDAETKRNMKLEDIANTGKSLKFAVVDDDIVIQELISKTFQKINTKICSYSDGDQFMNAVATENFDLVFLDLLMPVKDGFQVLKELKTRKIPVPVIVLSAVTQRETVIRAFNMGVKSYLTKPIKPEDFLVKSMEILRTNF
jgi:DNA-binding response OmpR family regulator